jgi:hypothetical protein
MQQPVAITLQDLVSYGLLGSDATQFASTNNIAGYITHLAATLQHEKLQSFIYLFGTYGDLHAIFFNAQECLQIVTYLRELSLEKIEDLAYVLCGLDASMLSIGLQLVYALVHKDNLKTDLDCVNFVHNIGESGN